ncbi:MAG: type II toxin-antitoxin system VapC family toxin [Rhodomicrobium sp.]
MDSSALVAIFKLEPGAAVYAKAVQDAGRLFISALTVLETGMVMRAGRGEIALARMWQFFGRHDYEIVPLNEAQAREALQAFGRHLALAHRLHLLRPILGNSAHLRL